MRFVLRVGLLAFLSILLLAPAVGAQDTGGSFGGGDWGGGGGDFGGGGGGDFGGGSTDWGSSSNDWGSSSSDDWSSSGGGGSYSGGGGGGGAFVCLFAVVMLITVASVIAAVAVPVAALSIGASAFRYAPKGGAGWGGVDVTAVRLALDWRARRAVQARLEVLARSGKTRSKAGLVELLHETVGLLEDARLSWLFADVVNHQPMSPQQARGTFESIAVDARSRFKEELVRARDGALTEQAASARTPKSHEGPGAVVVTLIVAARRELLDVQRDADANEIHRLLASLRTSSVADLVALEVVWSPADENDRMSTAELEARYPELARLDEASVGGRVFCGYCAGPYADELPQCPHCGAPHP
ncbi:MAG: DUF1517 domain-containing protein [Sandaracinaceae bacterium]